MCLLLAGLLALLTAISRSIPDLFPDSRSPSQIPISRLQDIGFSLVGIPPNSDIVFDIELLSVNGTKAPNAAPRTMAPDIIKEAGDSFLEGLALDGAPGKKSGGKKKGGAKSKKK